jgi:hypothetical protein
MTRTLVFALALAAAASACGRGGKPPISPSEVRALGVERVPASPDDPAWRTAPLHAAQLLPQDVVEPRLLASTTAILHVQALTDGRAVAFRLSWAAPARSDLAVPGRFVDACAVQLPASPGPEVPAATMGETGQIVEISYWSAAWQAVVDGRATDDIQALYPNARVDHYPFDSASLTKGSPEQLAMARRFAPAFAAGNRMAGPRTTPVEDLVSEGPGTLRPAPRSVSTGAGKPTPEGWAVVISRPLPSGVAPGGRSQVAFAIWQGALGEVGGRKMRTPWIALDVGGAR